MDQLSRRKVMAAAPLVVSAKTAFGSQANSAVGFGVIGTGGRGRYVGTLMAQDSNARLAAICDKYPDRIDQGKTEIPGADKVTSYRDYHELLNDKAVDAVLIATPVFLHPEHYEAAIQARKHIYCEKPAGAGVAGCKRMLRAWERRDRSKRIQFGFQQRFSSQYRKAHSYLTGGRIGEMKLMMSYWVLGYLPPAPAAKPAPAETEEQKIRRWGAWMKYSGGAIVEQDCHGIDTINWFARDLHPVSAVGRGGNRFPVPYGDWITDHHDVIYQYPEGIEGWLISIKHTAGYRDVKEQFYGVKGMLETSRSYMKLHGMTPNVRYKSADDLRDTSLMEREESIKDITAEATREFFQGILAGQALDMTKTSVESTLTAILGRMAIETRREVAWDEMMRSA
ncbi:MAG: Gfo/Idh/MocA family oxidoreductase [Acidobacteria bacterium]|nr:Gfo/Idh/MocA family oxidoreductase [Acidobacteriota bacterium]